LIALKNNMNNKIPPPIVTLFFGLCIYLSRPYFPEFSNSGLNSLSIISFVVGIFMLFITIFQIKPEEVAMEKLFDQEWKDYTKNVRRWL